MEMVVSFPLEGKEACKKREYINLAAHSVWSPHSIGEVNKQGDFFF